MLRLLLFPFAILYDIGTRVRNHLYNIGHKSSFSFDTMVISVGNLNAGGSGKTPMVEYLVELLHNTFRIVTLSRGYKRTTSGFREAKTDDTAATVGDEPLQLFQKFGDRIKVTVAEDRAFAIPNILHEWPETDVVLLDDAFQHRSVRPQLSILVTDYNRPFYKDFVLPAGMLRESRAGARRSDLIVVTKCDPHISIEERSAVVAKIRPYAPNQPVFFSAIHYGHPVAFMNGNHPGKKVVLVTGIANPYPLEQHCRSTRELVRHFRFRDHHAYSQEDLKGIESFCSSMDPKPSIFTTEKDRTRLQSTELLAIIDPSSWFYVPIRHEFVEDGPKFDEKVIQAIGR